jgi:hypothetical protein
MVGQLTESLEYKAIYPFLEVGEFAFSVHVDGTIR